MAESKKIIANNKKAYHDFFIEEKFECGIELFGTEVKSMRLGKCNLKDSYVRIINGEIFVMGMHISPYEKGNIFNREPMRVRKLLMHKKEIAKLSNRMDQDGLTLVPTEVYFLNGRVKVEIGLAKGKKLYDKRESLKEKQANREIEREFRERNR